jgi:LAO/AO transport system kinase
VGQAEHAVKALVDTVVLLMQPETGDAIQALKAGILEVADIIVISKSDMPGAERMRANLASTVRFGAQRAVGWTVPVLGVSVESGAGLDALEDAIDAHARWCAWHRDPRDTARTRARYRVQDLILRQLDGALASLTDAECELQLPALYATTVGKFNP